MQIQRMYVPRHYIVCIWCMRYIMKRVLTHNKPSVLFVGHRQTVQPDQTPQNAASDQVLHCLRTEVSFQIWIKMKNTTQQS